MKWWGWGDDGISFTHDDKPALAPFVKERIGIDLDSRPASVIDFDELDVAPPVLTDELRRGLEDAVGAKNVSTDAIDRVVHTYGKSLRDLVRIRRGDLGRLPDVIVFPGSEHEVTSLFEAAMAADAVVIPFGGGTNISGSLEAPRGETRTVVSVDLGRMNTVIEIDEASGLARIQAGAMGPWLEEQLNARGFTIGHFPDSFTYSTLGGWIATRSSGMQSDKYGDIADLTRAVRVVTPNGLLETRPVPTTSTGPSVREMILGSEGRLGIITEATVHVHRLPQERVILGYLFPDWASGLAAMHDIAASDASPSVTRVSDAKETAFSFATSKDSGFLGKLQTTVLKQYLQRRKGFDLEAMCLSFIGYEGAPDHVKRNKSLVGEIVKSHGGLCVGSGPGELYDQKKFDTPYIRDFLLDRGGMADVSETSAPWGRLLDLYNGVTDAAWKTFSDLGVQGWIMCHLSHSYHAGACLYFTFAFKPTTDDRALTEYDVVKHAIQSEFMSRGATLSHHHAVGVEHKEWLAEDVSPAGVAMVKALLEGVDPGHNLNPGKIVDD
jgi:alkyldihydroxyacetonephosphate synthase